MEVWKAKWGLNRGLEAQVKTFKNTVDSSYSVVTALGPVVFSSTVVWACWEGGQHDKSNNHIND